MAPGMGIGLLLYEYKEYHLIMLVIVGIALAIGTVQMYRYRKHNVKPSTMEVRGYIGAVIVFLFLLLVYFLKFVL